MAFPGVPGLMDFFCLLPHCRGEGFFKVYVIAHDAASVQLIELQVVGSPGYACTCI